MLFARILGTLALTLALASQASAGIEAVDTTDLAPGGRLVLDGVGFGTKKAKVFLQPKGAGKTVTLKVLSQIDTRIEAQFKKGAAGQYELRVRPKGGEEFVYEEPVEIRLPCVLDVQPANAQPGDEVVLLGRDFGDKKGKVTVGGLKAKVLDWDRDVIDGLDEIKDRIRVVLNKNAKKTANGSQTIVLRNTIGEVESKTDLVLTGGALSTYCATIGGKSFCAVSKFGLPGYDPNGLGGTAFQGFSGKFGSKGVKTLSVSMAGFDPTNFSGDLPFTVSGSDLTYLYSEGAGPNADFWSSNFGLPLAGETTFVTITSIAGGVVSGFGQAPGMTGIGGNAQGTTLDVMDFQFSIPMIPQ